MPIPGHRNAEARVRCRIDDHHPNLIARFLNRRGNSPPGGHILHQLSSPPTWQGSGPHRLPFLRPLLAEQAVIERGGGCLEIASREGFKLVHPKSEVVVQYGQGEPAISVLIKVVPHRFGPHASPGRIAGAELS